MALFDEDQPRPRAIAAVGDDLSRFSEDELRERIAVLQAEIVRVEGILRGKEESRKAAGSFFKL